MPPGIVCKASWIFLLSLIGKKRFADDAILMAENPLVKTARPSLFFFHLTTVCIIAAGLVFNREPLAMTLLISLVIKCYL